MTCAREEDIENGANTVVETASQAVSSVLSGHFSGAEEVRAQNGGDCSTERLQPLTYILIHRFLVEGSDGLQAGQNIEGTIGKEVDSIGDIRPREGVEECGFWEFTEVLGAPDARGFQRLFLKAAPGLIHSVGMRRPGAASWGLGPIEEGKPTEPAGGIGEVVIAELVVR